MKCKPQGNERDDGIFCRRETYEGQSVNTGANLLRLKEVRHPLREEKMAMAQTEPVHGG